MQVDTAANKMTNNTLTKLVRTPDGVFDDVVTAAHHFGINPKVLDTWCRREYHGFMYVWGLAWT